MTVVINEMSMEVCESEEALEFFLMVDGTGQDLMASTFPNHLDDICTDVTEELGGALVE